LAQTRFLCFFSLDSKFNLKILFVCLFVCFVLFLCILALRAYLLHITGGRVLIEKGIKSDNFDIVLLYTVLILISCVMEELLFRGYLTRVLSTFTTNTWLVVFFVNVVFAATHIEGRISDTTSWLYLIRVFLLGVAASILVLQTGSLSSAIGLHFANNMFGYILTPTSNQLSDGTYVFSVHSNLNHFESNLTLIIAYFIMIVIVGVYIKYWKNIQATA